MQKLPLGRTGLTVSPLCLGTMTWGNQTTEGDAHAQADLALAQGVDFWDTAELYPVNPIRTETVGNTEAIIGRWLASRGARAGRAGLKDWRGRVTAHSRRRTDHRARFAGRIGRVFAPPAN